MTSPTTAWQRVALDIAARIRSGETPVGAKIASHRQLMERYDAALGTIKRALDYLQAEGVVRAVQGSGVFVLQEPDGDLDFTPTTPDGLTERLVRLEDAVAGLESGEASIQEVIGIMQATLIELCDRNGIPNPFAQGTSGRQRRQANRRRVANG